MQSVWKKCANELNDKHLQSIISYLIPKLKENDTVEIFAVNPEQQKYIQQNIIQITDILYPKLKNNCIKIDIKIKTDTEDITPFTAREKYDYMVDKNPLLNKLVHEFGLRLD